MPCVPARGSYAMRRCRARRWSNLDPDDVAAAIVATATEATEADTDAISCRSVDLALDAAYRTRTARPHALRQERWTPAL